MKFTYRKAGLVTFALWAACTLMLPAEAASPARHGAVVTAQHLATDAGLQILKQGGNAVDAAVAVGYAEAVTNPCCGNIGGGGFLLLHLANGKDTVINFRETAPAGASAGMYQDSSGALIPNASLIGYKAVAIPGTVAGLDYALRKYGRLSRQRVIGPAIRLARDGFVLTQGDADIIAAQAPQFRADPKLAQIFLRPDGSPVRAGDRLVQRDLAGTLSAIAAKGPDAFYKGPVASAIAQASGANGGVLALADLAHYRPEELQPLTCGYRGYDVISVPPPSSGGVSLCEILNILDGYDLKALGFHSAASTRLLIEAMRHAYADRNDSLGDPDFVKNPVGHLTSAAYAAQIRESIDQRHKPAVSPDYQDEKPQTTHFSIVDKDGNAASLTYTLNGAFGALVMAPGTGVLLNDEMDDFTTKLGAANQFGLVQGANNAIAAGKRPLSSMSPTILLKDGKPVLVLGSPGGSRIITAVLEALINVVDYGMTPQAAVDAPRIHYQGQPDTVFVEAGALSPSVRATLEQDGYQFQEQPPWCAVELVKAEEDGLIGANDSRRPAGSAAGY